MLLTRTCFAGEVPTTEPEFKGDGLCQFALHGFALTAQSEASINQAVEKLIAKHELAFGFRRSPEFRLRMRVYSRFVDFTNSTAMRGLTNLQGVYVSRTKEIVTFRQEIPGSLGTTLLHEASHAIMDAHFRRSPQWLLEGCAEYFAYPPDMQDARDKFSLRTRWGLLNIWMRDGKLASLSSFVNLKQADWDKLDIDRAYTTSWSIFQYLASSEANRMVVRKLLTPRGFQGELSSEGSPRAETDGATLLEKEYPGGLKKLEMDWHRWIVQTGRQLFPERSLDRLRELDQERERRQGGP